MENIKKIKLTRGKVTLVDAEDFEWLNQWKWYCDARGYAVRDAGGRENRKHIKMHRLLNNTPRGFVTDHINRNKLDNRKANLRTATSSTNLFNRGLNKNNKSGYKGVVWREDTKRWTARIKIFYKNIYLGCYKSKRKAIAARKSAEIAFGV